MNLQSMQSNDYRFITHWRVQSTLEEICDLLSDAPDLARWWPAVYLDVQEVKPGGANGMGKVVRLYTKGWLPYTLHWEFVVDEVNRPHGFGLQAQGDLVGRGTWRFEQDGDFVDITYDWAVRADKPLLRRFSFVLKPLFSANHRWAMKTGEISLGLELERRHALTVEARDAVPAPPKTTFGWLVAGKLARK